MNIDRRELSDKVIRHHQEFIARNIKFVDPNQSIKVPVDGVDVLGAYKESPDFFACFKEDKRNRILRFYLNFAHPTEKSDELHASIVSNIIGVKIGNDFILQYVDKKYDNSLVKLNKELFGTGFVYLASLYCAVEKFLKKAGVNEIIVPPVKSWGDYLVGHPEYSYALKRNLECQKNPSCITGVYNHYKLLGFGAENPDVKIGEGCFIGTKTTDGLLLEDFLKGVKSKNI